MTVTVNLPQQVEQAYLAAARSKGVTVDALVADLLVSHAPSAEPPNGLELTNVKGIPVLRSGQPLDPALVAATLEQIRHERDMAVLG